MLTQEGSVLVQLNLELGRWRAELLHQPVPPTQEGDKSGLAGDTQVEDRAR